MLPAATSGLIFRQYNSRPCGLIFSDSLLTKLSTLINSDRVECPDHYYTFFKYSKHNAWVYLAKCDKKKKTHKQYKSVAASLHRETQIKRRPQTFITFTMIAKKCTHNRYFTNRSRMHSTNMEHRGIHQFTRTGKDKFLYNY